MKNVLKISDAAILALHSMAIMAQKNDELVSVKDVAQMLQVSANHLSKVLQRLVKSGLVTSIKGYGGGFKLQKEPAQITFLDIYEAIDGEFELSNCLLSKPACESNCIMGDLVSSINNQVDTYFRNTTLEKFVK